MNDDKYDDKRSRQPEREFDGMMPAMALDRPRSPLRESRIPIPFPGEFDIVVRVSACGVCRTDLHIADGDLAPHKSALVPGHEIVGTVVAGGELAQQFSVGERVGIPWLGGTCRHCTF